MQALYTASATATGDGRGGHTRSSDGVLDLDLAVPKEMGGPGGALTNPEQLFAAGYSACLHSAVKTIAKGSGIDVTDSAIRVEIGLVKGDTGFSLFAQLYADVDMKDGSDSIQSYFGLNYDVSKLFGGSKPGTN